MRRLDELRKDMLPAVMKIDDSALLREKEDADGVLSKKKINCDLATTIIRDYFDITPSAALNMASNEPFSLRPTSAFSAAAR